MKRRWWCHWAVWAGIAYLGLSPAFVAHELRSENTQDVLHDQLCSYTTFTRRTQRMVVRYVEGQARAGARYAMRPELRAFYRSQIPLLQALKARTGPPPPCD